MLRRTISVAPKLFSATTAAAALPCFSHRWNTATSTTNNAPVSSDCASSWVVTGFTDKTVTVHAQSEQAAGDTNINNNVLHLPARWIAHNSSSVRHSSGQRFETIRSYLKLSEEIAASKITDAKMQPAKTSAGATDAAAGTADSVLEVSFDNGRQVDRVPFAHIARYAARPELATMPYRVVADAPARKNAEPSSSTTTSRREATAPSLLVGADSIQRVPFESLSILASVKDTKAQYDKDLAMLGLYRDGLVVVENCPNSTDAILQLADFLGAPAGAMHTLYGRTFMVQRKPPSGPANNIAYSGEFLDLHNDLVYYQSMPGLQMLHCMEFHDSVTGGESFFCDAFAAANRLRDEMPAAFETLCTIPTAWMKDDMGREVPAMYYYAAPMIQRCPLSGNITCVRWAPAFEAPMPVKGYAAPAPPVAEPRKLSPVEAANAKRAGQQQQGGISNKSTADNDENVDVLTEYHAAYDAFAAMLAEVMSESKLEFRLKPGETVIWNQARMLHGRNAFVEQEPGMRKLHGCYVNIDDWRSRCMSRFALTGISTPNWSFCNGSSR